MLLDPHRLRIALDAIEVSPSLQRSISLEDGDVSVPAEGLADDVDLPARVMPKVNELAAQRGDRPLGGSAVPVGGEIDREAAFNMTGDKRADQFNGVHGGDDRRDQFRIPFLLVMLIWGRTRHRPETGILCDAVEPIYERCGFDWALTPETNRSASMVATDASGWKHCPRLSQIALGKDDSVTPGVLRPTTGQEGIADPPHYGSDLGVDGGRLSRGCHGVPPARGSLRTAQGNDAGMDRGSLRWGSGQGKEW